MYYDDLYKILAQAVDKNIYSMWPDRLFSHARWSEIAKNWKNVCKEVKELASILPREVRIGDYLINKHGGGNITVPFSWEWCRHRGIVICPDPSTYNVKGGYETEKYMNNIGGIASQYLLRIFVQTAGQAIHIHKIDTERLGKDLILLPNESPNISLLVNNSEIQQLLHKIKERAKNVTANKWRCDMSVDAMDFPLQFILIANWDSLCEKSEGQRKKLSSTQEDILRILQTDIAARNGVYFVICSTAPVEIDNLPFLYIDGGGREKPSGVFIGRRSDRRKKDKQEHVPIKLQFSFPSANTLQSVYESIQYRRNGEDTDDTCLWESRAEKGLKAIIGATTDGANQFFELGVGKGAEAYHALIGGATGSGKSVLLSEIICSLAERYSPEELRFILLDYKEGTEFAPYRNLPHVLALSIGSNSEFGLESLKWLDKETERRGQLFKDADVSNIGDYRRSTGKKMCRYVFIADEFQVLCSDRKYGTDAKHILNDLARRGRSFGIHLILSTQTLRDGSLDGEARNQFSCRICLRLAESETSYFLSSDNDVPAHFTKKGEAVLNYALGQKSGNILFRSGNKAYSAGYRTRDEVRKCVSELQKKAIDTKITPKNRFIYDGDDFVLLSAELLNPDKGFVLGYKNNMASDTFFLSTRHIEGGVIIVGNDTSKNRMLMNLLSEQAGLIYGQNCPVLTLEAFLDSPQVYPLTFLQAEEGDQNWEDDPLMVWRDLREDDRGESEKEAATLKAIPVNTFTAPKGGEEEFAALMQDMHMNAIMSESKPSTLNRRKTRRKITHPLVLALPTHADVKTMEAYGMSFHDFRIHIYSDMQAYNQLSSADFESGKLPASQVIVEYPKGVVNKVRVGVLKK